MTTRSTWHDPWHSTYDVTDELMRRDFNGPIVVMTDGTPRSDHALAAAALLGARTGSTVGVLSIVIEHEPAFPAPDDPRGVSAGVRDRRAAVMRQVSLVAGPAADWPVDVIAASDSGSAAAAFAESRGARLLVVSREGHAADDREGSGSLALAVVEHSGAPVYVVASDGIALAHTAIIGADLGPSALRIARIAASLIAQQGNVTLLRVIETDEDLVPAGRMEHDLEAARRALESTTSSLRTISRISCMPSIVFGDVAKKLVALSHASSLTVVAIGMSRSASAEPGAGRSRGRKVAAELVGNASCPVLVVPTITVTRRAPS